MLNCVNSLEPHSINSGIERAALMISEEKQPQQSHFLFETSLPCEDGAIPLTDSSNLLGPYLSRLYYGALATPTPPRRNNNNTSNINNSSNTTNVQKDDNRRHSTHGRYCGTSGSTAASERCSSDARNTQTRTATCVPHHHHQQVPVCQNTGP